MPRARESRTATPSGNPEVVEGFQAALARANELVAEDSQIRRDAVVEHGGMPQEVADAVNLPVYETDFAVDGMQDIADRMAGTGFLAEELDVANLLAN